MKKKYLILFIIILSIMLSAVWADDHVISNGSFESGESPWVHTFFRGSVPAETESRFSVVTNVDNTNEMLSNKSEFFHGQKGGEFYMRDTGGDKGEMISYAIKQPLNGVKTITNGHYVFMSWAWEREYNCWITPDTRVTWAGLIVEAEIISEAQTNYLRYFQPPSFSSETYSSAPSNTKNIRYIHLSPADNYLKWSVTSNLNLTADIEELFPEEVFYVNALSIGIAVYRPLDLSTEEIRFTAAVDNIKITPADAPFILFQKIPQASYTNHLTSFPSEPYVIKAASFEITPYHTGTLLTSIDLKSVTSFTFGYDVTSINLRKDEGYSDLKENTVIASFKHDNVKNKWTVKNLSENTGPPGIPKKYLITSALRPQYSSPLKIQFYIPAKGIELKSSSNKVKLPFQKKITMDTTTVYKVTSQPTSGVSHSERSKIYNSIIEGSDKYLKFYNSSPGTTIKIYNGTGRLIKRVRVNEQSGKIRVEDTWPPGIYTAVFENKAGENGEKIAFIVQ